jgi:hypothetical protein
VNRSAADTAEDPRVVVTTTSAVPVPGGLVALISVGETTTTLVAAAVPNRTVAPDAKLRPVICTLVPPAAGPWLG